jgi:hypothetical protein
VSALATFFKVKPDYFFHDIYAAKIDHDLELLSQLQGYVAVRETAHVAAPRRHRQEFFCSMRAVCWHATVRRSDPGRVIDGRGSPAENRGLSEGGRRCRGA